MLIGLTGAARSGKDTVAHMLAKLDGYQRVALADPIKRMTETLLDMNPVVLEQMKDKQLAFLNGVTPRRILQTLGTEWGRHIILEDIWLRFAEERIDVLRRMGYENIVVTDIRFDNEAKMIHRLGGEVHEVTRPDCEEVEGHSSEAGIDPRLIDGVIRNNRDLEFLRNYVQEWLTMLELSPPRPQ